MATFRELIDGLEALSITGVTTNFAAGPPSEVKPAQLPAKWLDIPHGNERPSYAGVEGGTRTMSVDLVVALEQVIRDISTPASFDTIVTMMDNIATALRGYSSPLMGPMTWQSRITIVPIGQTWAFWCVVTTISGLG